MNDCGHERRVGGVRVEIKQGDAVWANENLLKMISET